mmetsp:Transcript_11229/g.23961  ORF Transcript_11229/g.23961 Transcript_11229/m.23961 type:complete len:242 (-) Transcript_11229:275-1000(-)
MNRSTLGLGAHVFGGICGAMGLSKGMTACNQSYSLGVRHSHAQKCCTNVLRGLKYIWIAIGTLRINVNQSHLNSTKRLLQSCFVSIRRSCSIVVSIIIQPFMFMTPINILLGCKGIDPSTSKPEWFHLTPLSHHRFDGYIPCQDDQIRPANGLSVLLLDGPENNSACFVEVGIIRPRIKRRQADISGVTSSPSIEDTIRPSRMPCQTNHQRPIVSIISRPCRIRCCQCPINIVSQCSHIQL